MSFGPQRPRRSRDDVEEPDVDLEPKPVEERGKVEESIEEECGVSVDLGTVDE